MNATTRPILIDEADGPCELCAAHLSNTCDHCGLSPLDPRDREMGVAGYQSVKPSHFHLVQVNGIPGRKGFHQELCYNCHRQDRFEVYGEEYGEGTAHSPD